MIENNPFKHEIRDMQTNYDLECTTKIEFIHFNDCTPLIWS